MYHIYIRDRNDCIKTVSNLTHFFLQLIGGISYMITCTRGEASHWFSTAILNEMPCCTERESPLCFTHTHMTARVYGVDGLCMLEQLLYTVSDVSLRSFRDEAYVNQSCLRSCYAQAVPLWGPSGGGRGEVEKISTVFRNQDTRRTSINLFPCPLQRIWRYQGE